MKLDFDLVQTDTLDLDRPLHTLAAAGGSRWNQLRGTRALMLAVLENAIQAYVRGKGRARIEATVWFKTAAVSSPFSFVVVCETLGLEPECVRAAVAKLGDGATPARKRARVRPNVRT